MKSFPSENEVTSSNQCGIDPEWLCKYVGGYLILGFTRTVDLEKTPVSAEVECQTLGCGSAVVYDYEIVFPVIADVGKKHAIVSG